MKGEVSKARKRRRGGNYSRNRNRVMTKQVNRVIDDDNTTNSEASEHAVYSDINWEENLEVDATSLLEEFAPQALHRPVKSSSPVSTEVKETETKEQEVNEEHELSDVESLSDFHISLKLLVHNYKTNQWIGGVVEEIDWEEEEILIRYDGSCDSPEEWLSMRSQRLKKQRKSPKSPLAVGITPKETHAKVVVKQAVVPQPPPPAEPIKDTPTKPPTLPSRPNPKARKRITAHKIKGAIKKPAFKKVIALSAKVKQRGKRQVGGKVNRRLPIWKAHTAVGGNASSKAILSGKFLDSEKVLAKWSDHRMQKFPAVIKKVCGGGLYDVLFYDGFEKTISEENIYKTNDEEIAKYKESKPSEADSFVDMDVSSKHERRQKKRKTFDDFIEEKDLKRKRKGNAYDLNSSESFHRASLSRSKPTLQSFSVHIKGRGGLSVPKAMAASPRHPQVSPVQDVPQTKIQEEPLDQASTNPSFLPSTARKEHHIHPEVKQKHKETDSVLDNTSHDQPLKITCHDGVVRKSILITDEKLPPDWTKHVISWVEGVHACFLFTPDRYAVHSIIELRKYFRVSEGIEPPEGLDFSFPKESLQDLTEEQKSLVPMADYRKWVNKVLDERKVMKKVRILPPSRSVPAGHYPAKRVRTLLPRYRSLAINQGTTVKTLEGKVWRCPKEGCDKKFRKENLLQMHIKHYHVELSALAGCAPNVVDLALARSADSAWTSEPKRSVPKSPIYEQISDKIDEELNVPSVLDVINDIKVGMSSSQSSLGTGVQPSTQSGTQGLVQSIASPLRVFTPAKHSRQRSESEVEPIDSETESVFSEKSRVHSTPKINSKKYADQKHIDEGGYMAGSRGLRRKQQSLDRTHNTDSNDGFQDEESREEDVILEQLQNEEVINCTCGFREEDGLMVQCEICLCWQHGACHGMEKDSDVPERYVCSVCLDPMNVRSTQRYSYASHYLTLTKLPRFNYRTCKEDILRHRERILSKSFELTANLQSIHKMERALTAKINIAEQSDHPKLYLWSTNWDSPRKKHLNPNPKKPATEISDKGRRGPVGEEPIESVDCRLRLLDRIEADQQDMESRLTIIQAQLQALESEDFEISGEEREGGGGGDPLLKQAVYMLLRDLNTLATAASLS